jgi:hypothetical protein
VNQFKMKFFFFYDVTCIIIPVLQLARTRNFETLGRFGAFKYRIYSLLFLGSRFPFFDYYFVFSFVCNDFFYF